MHVQVAQGMDVIVVLIYMVCNKLQLTCFFDIIVEVFGY